jgi:hypothetical protein
MRIPFLKEHPASPSLRVRVRAGLPRRVEGRRRGFRRPSRRTAMSKHTTRVGAGNDRASLYTEITDKIIAELEAGRIPWVQPWGTAAIKAPLAMPRNAATQRGYCADPVGCSHRGWLLRTELADLSPGARARRPCQEGRAGNDRRLCRSLHTGRRTSARRGSRRGAGPPSPFSSALPSSTRTSAMACPRRSLLRSSRRHRARLSPEPRL